MTFSSELEIALQKVLAVTAAHAHDVRAAVPLVSRRSPLASHTVSVLVAILTQFRPNFFLYAFHVPPKYAKAGPGTRALYLEMSTLIANLDLDGAGAELARLKPAALM